MVYATSRTSRRVIMVRLGLIFINQRCMNNILMRNIVR